MAQKHRQIFKNIAAAVCFLLLVVVLFQTVSAILLDKEQTWYKHRNYTALAKNSVDILYVGNSHFNAAIDPPLVDEVVGGDVFSFNYSVSGMRMEYAYWRLAHALETQSPRLVVLDTFCLVPLHEEENADNVVCWSLDGLPLSPGKIAAVNDLIPFENRAPYYVPLLKYHARWEALTAEDVVSVFDKRYYDWLGRAPETLERAMEREDDHFEQDLSRITEQAPLQPLHEEYLRRFIALCEENGAEVLLFGTPYRSQFGQNSADGVRTNNYLRATVVDGDRVQLADMNEQYVALGVTYSDMRDDGHVNYEGSEKTSRYLGEYIRQHYGALFGA